MITLNVPSVNVAERVLAGDGNFYPVVAGQVSVPDRYAAALIAVGYAVPVTAGTGPTGATGATGQTGATGP
jgi:hypothetical protein